MLTIFSLPALIVSLLSIRVLIKRKNRPVFWLWKLMALTPLLFLTYEAGKVAVWSFQNVGSGNGSARAANGIVFIALVTLAAIYGLIMAVWVFPKNRFYLLTLVFLGVGIIATAIAYDSYDYYKLSQWRRVGSFPKNKIIGVTKQLSGLLNPVKRSALLL